MAVLNHDSNQKCDYKKDNQGLNELDVRLEQAYTRSYIQTGFALTTGAARKIKWATGDAIVGGTRYSPAASSGIGTDNAFNWVYLNSSGVVSVATTKPSGTYAPIGVAQASGNSINRTRALRARFPDVDGSGNITIANTAPKLVLTDTTASAKSLTIAVDADIADLRESAGASGSLLVLDLANNRVSIGTTTPLSVNATSVPGAGLEVSGSTANPSNIVIDNDSTGVSRLLLNQGSQAANNRVWSLATAGGALNVQSLNDALTVKNTYLAMDPNGNTFVGGPGTPGEKLHVAGTMRMDTWPATGDTAAYRDDATGNLSLVTSDIRLKTGIELVPYALERVRQINAYTFWMRGKEDQPRRYGVIAQELLPVAPELTYVSMVDEQGEPYYGVHHDKLSVLLLAALKELDGDVNRLIARVHALEKAA